MLLLIELVNLFKVYVVLMYREPEAPPSVQSQTSQNLTIDAERYCHQRFLKFRKCQISDF